MNCSGKHAAMLVACVARSWSTHDYLDPDHPLQRRPPPPSPGWPARRSRTTRVDGCGAPLFGLPLTGLARTFQALVTAPAGSDEALVARGHAPTPGVRRRLAGHPNTDLMRALPGVLAKGGAEGVLAVAAPDGHAVAVKAIDGYPAPPPPSPSPPSTPSAYLSVGPTRCARCRCSAAASRSATIHSCRMSHGKGRVMNTFEICIDSVEGRSPPRRPAPTGWSCAPRSSTAG